jgi:hypothetical protein
MSRSIEASLSWDQRQTLTRLQLLLRRRCLAELLGLASQGGRMNELLRALDLAIVGSYRLTCTLEVGEQAEALLAGFRAARFFAEACLEPPPYIGVPPDEPTAT